MIVVIDAYNAIRFFEKVEGVRLIEESIKKRFVSRMQSYANARRSSISDLLVIFDGGDFRWAVKEQKSNLQIVHSGQCASADDWIMAFLEQCKKNERVLVTNDRALAFAAERLGAFVLDVGVFFDCVAVAIEKRHETKNEFKKSPLIEYFSEDEFENSNKLSLRELMEGSTRAIMEKKVDQVGNRFRAERRVGNSQSCSKEELRVRRIMKKL